MLDLPTDLSRKYRYQFRVSFLFGTWRYSYELVGARGGIHLHVDGPHKYGGEHYSAGLELHSRTPLYRDAAPDHEECWLLKCPCWHDGTSLHAQEAYLPLVLAGEHGEVFRRIVSRADEQWPADEQS
jgi:hypothetical protein